MNKKVILSLLLLLIICVTGTAAIMVGLFFVSQSISESSQTTQPPTPLELSLPSSPASGAESGQSSAKISADQARQMDTIQRQVINMRGLTAKKTVIRDLLTTDELKQKVETEFFINYTSQDAADDSLLLQTLGLLPRGFDLLDFYERLYAEQVAGFYDSKTKEMYVVDVGTFGGTERMTYAHEYTHTLQDQNYDLQNGLKINEQYCRHEPEYCSAVTALVEGDATFIEQKWLFEYATNNDKEDLQAFVSSYDSPVFNSAPRYMKKDFLFPYEQGLEFVYSLNDRGGYTFVDEAFKNPPISTEQILHPEKYPSEKFDTVSLPYLTTLLPGNWSQVNENILGEWYSYLVLAQARDETFSLPDDTARAAAAGWNGDRYALYRNDRDGSVVFVLRSRWDRPADAVEFYKATRQYGLKRWGNSTAEETNVTLWESTADGSVSLRMKDSETLWIIAPDRETQDIVLKTIPDFNTNP